MRGSNWRAPSPLPADRRWAACWWDGLVRRRRLDLPPHSPSSRSCCCPESMSPPAQPAPRRHPLQDIKEGAVFVLHHPLLRPVFITQFIFNTASFLMLAVFVPYAVRQSRSLGFRHRHDTGDVRRRHGRRRAAGDAGDAAAAFGTVIALGPVTGFVAAVVMALTTLIPPPAGGPQLLPARGRADPVGDHHRDIAAIRDAAAAAGTGLRDQHHELWRAAGRRRVRRHRRRVLRRRGVPLSRGRDLRRAGAGDPDVAGGLAGAAAGDGRRGGQSASGPVDSSPSSLPGVRRTASHRSPMAWIHDWCLRNETWMARSPSHDEQMPVAQH